MGRVLVQQPGTNTTKASTEILPKNVIIVDEDLHQLRLHDGTTPGGHVIGSSGGGNNSNALLSFMWADHQLNDVSWLRADTFSWQSGDVYTAAYEHLVADCENAQTTAYYAWTGEGFIAGTQETVYTTSQVPSIGDTVYYYDSNGLIRFGTVKTVSSANITFTYIVGGETSSSMAYGGEVQLPVHMETVAGVTITYCLSQDGHKICLPNQESNIAALYEATGVAWYYILDTANQRFKLPRTKWGFTGLRDGVGGYVEAGLPNITGEINRAVITDGFSASGAFSLSGSSGTVPGYNSGAPQRRLVAFAASRSSSVYGNSNTVQPKATEMYLYFYVGNFEQSAIEQTAGLNAEMFNDLNSHKVISFQAPTSANNYTWYRKYADGWVEQGGIVFPTTTTPTRVSITLPVIMSSNVYSVQVTGGDNVADAGEYSYYTNRTTTGFEILHSHTTSSYTIGDSWQVSGVSAQ